MAKTKKPKFDLAAIRQKALLTGAEATALGYFVSDRAASILRSRGKGPVYVQTAYGARVFYRSADLARWAAQNARDPALPAKGT